MGREIRRVPVGWQHPMEPNPHWVFQQAWRHRTGRPEYKLTPPNMRFSPLFDDFLGAVADAREERRQITERTGRGWEFNVEYHLTGCRDLDTGKVVVHPMWIFDGDEERQVDVRDGDHLAELLLSQVADPDPAEYMPVWPEGTELGWCLYETVSDGTPITPVCPTAEALVEHLCTEGDDWEQTPWRREAAEQMVGQGSAPSFVVHGGQVLEGGRDSDRIAQGT